MADFISQTSVLESIRKKKVEPEKLDYILRGVHGSTICL